MDERRRHEFEQGEQERMEGRRARAGRTSVHGIIPSHFFSSVSSECRDIFIDGHFYGTISLAQAYVEGLFRYVGKVHPVGADKDLRQKIRRLAAAGFITEDSAKATDRIWGSRNTFHHVNEDIPSDPKLLEARAEECIHDLKTIESDLFGHTILHGGTLSPTRAEYWPPGDKPGMTSAFLRLGRR